MMDFRDSAVRRWLAQVCPSFELRDDPLQDVWVEGRYTPVPVAGWKLVPWVAAALRRERVFRPLTFSATERLTVVIPIRDREEHLRALVPRLAEVLAEQAVRYRILVCEQEPGAPFNRGALINTGLRHAADWTDYFCIHDVDAIPVVANYLCPSQPLRLVTRLAESDRGESRGPRYFSGAISIRREQAFAANGFSNEYWGWGKEDDDFFFRLLLTQCLCYADMQGTFYDLPNPQGQQVNTDNAAKRRQLRLNRKRRSRLMRGLSQPLSEGLNSLRYRIIAHSRSDAYERILVRW